MPNKKPPLHVSLKRVGKRNKADVLALRLANDQEDFVATNAKSLAEAEDDEDARPRAIVVDDRVVGFLMYDASEDEAVIYRFMVDRNEQGKGYGRAALAAAMEEIVARSHVRDITVCYMPENVGARRLYQAAGFVEEGTDEDGEIMARLSVSRK